MRLVSENTDAEMAKEQATLDVAWALRDLTANLLRVVRGAGKAYMIPKQTQAVLLALIAYRDAVGTSIPDHELSEILATGQDHLDASKFTDAEVCRNMALDTIVRGSLQVAASRLVGQGTQERAGDTEMYRGIIEIERLREEARAARDRAPRRTFVAVRPRSKKVPKT